jgi:hypothetical protein
VRIFSAPPLKAILLSDMLESTLRRTSALGAITFSSLPLLERVPRRRPNMDEPVTTRWEKYGDKRDFGRRSDWSFCSGCSAAVRHAGG